MLTANLRGFILKVEYGHEYEEAVRHHLNDVKF